MGKGRGVEGEGWNTGLFLAKVSVLVCQVGGGVLSCVGLGRVAGRDWQRAGGWAEKSHGAKRGIFDPISIRF